MKEIIANHQVRAQFCSEKIAFLTCKKKAGEHPGIHNFSTLLTFEESESFCSKKSRPLQWQGRLLSSPPERRCFICLTPPVPKPFASPSKCPLGTNQCPTKQEKGTSSTQTCLGWGYVNFQEGNNDCTLLT